MGLVGSDINRVLGGIISTFTLNSELLISAVSGPITAPMSTNQLLFNSGQLGSETDRYHYRRLRFTALRQNRCVLLYESRLLEHNIVLLTTYALYILVFFSKGNTRLNNMR